MDILKDHPQGVRYSDIVNGVKERLRGSDIPQNTINTLISTFLNGRKKPPQDVYKVSRGLFQYSSNKESEKEDVKKSRENINEKDFYEPFANYLTADLEECTKAIPLGGKKFADKWGTPDVIGKNESNRSDIIKHETEIVTAEIKTDDSSLITAFGQACAYKSFSHKVYIVIPKSASEEDKSRVESLSLIFGIGLIFFDANSKENPQFEIRVRPIKHEPDSFYVNKYLKLVEKDLFN